MVKMPRRFKRMCEVYKIFASDWHCDFSESAMLEMYEFETFGKGDIDLTGFNTIGKKANGYAVGKKWLNVSVTGWLDNIEKFGWAYEISELNKDQEIPRWFIEDFFNKVRNKTKKRLEDNGFSSDEFTKNFNNATE